MNNYNKIIEILNTHQKKNFYILIIYQVIKSILEVMSLGSLYPLIFFMFNGDISFLNDFFNFNYFNKIELFTILLIIIFAVFFIKTISIIYITYKENYYLTTITKELQSKIFNLYLQQDYSFFINRKNEKLLNNIITEVTYFSKNQIQPLYLLINEAIKIILIFVIILIINPFYTLISILIFLPILIIFIKKIKKKLSEIGILRKRNSEKMINFALKGFNSIREILIFENQNIFSNQFKEYVSRLQNVVFKNNLFAVIPKILFEFIVVIYILTIFLISLKFTSNSIEQTFIYLSFLSVSFVRLIPSINTVIKSIQDLSYYNTSTEILKASKKLRHQIKSKIEKIDHYYNFNNIEIKNLSYDFFGKKIFENTSFKLKKNFIYGITGDSGSGKTTLFNILIGFLKPKKGKILIDNEDFSLIEKKWQKNLCYIPQDLYLFEDTIERNITLSKDKPNLKSLERAINISKLYKLVSKYTKKTKHRIKNSGIDLSGGQRQRIGIARSLYINRNIIFLDETTNALDEKTEAEILSSLKNEFKNKTVFIISHSKDLHKYVDRIIKIKNKKITVTNSNAR